MRFYFQYYSSTKYYEEDKRTRFIKSMNTTTLCTTVLTTTPSRNTRKSNLSYRLFCARPYTTGSRTGPRSSRWLSLLCLPFARFAFLYFNAYNRFSEKEREEYYFGQNLLTMRNYEWKRERMRNFVVRMKETYRTCCRWITSSSRVDSSVLVFHQPSLLLRYFLPLFSSTTTRLQSVAYSAVRMLTKNPREYYYYSCYY